MRFKFSFLPLLIILLGTAGIAATQFSDVTIKSTLSVGTNKLVVVSGGNVGVNKSNPSTALDVSGTATATAFVGPLTGAASSNVLKSGDTMTGALTVDNTGSPTSNASIYSSAIGTSNDPLGAFTMKRARASTTATSSGDSIGQVTFQGHDGSAYRNASSIYSAVDGTVSSGIVPGRMAFFTQNTSGTNTERMRIDSAGNVGIATTSPSAKLHVNGTLKIGAYTLPSTDGTAGQVPTTNGSGTVTWTSKGTVPPTIQKFTSGSGTYNKSYVFFVSSANATAGATYTNNSVTFTVSETISSGTTLIATGSGDPSASGTLTKATGTGDSTITFSTYAAPIFLRVRMVGGGGGGAGSAPVGTGNPTLNQGGAGGNTTFGSSLLTANGGSGAPGGGGSTTAGGAGGTSTIGAGASGIAITGAYGSGGSQGVTSDYLAGGFGGSSPFGGAGPGGAGNIAGVGAVTNSGSGGGGGGSTGNSGGSTSGAGGGAGGFIDANVAPVSSTYSYSVGAAGALGTGTNGGVNGGAGGAGIIIVEEHYQ